MSPATTRQLLKIGLKTPAELHPDFDGLVRFPEYVESMRPALANNPAAAMRQIYQTARQIVLVAGNQFSLEAKLTFPIVHHDYSLLNLCVWAERFVHAWFADLSRKEQILFRSLKFMPAGK